VLDPQSYRYYVKFLLADKIISSQFDAALSNPFIPEGGRMCDLFRHKFVFLAHGIHKDDISGLLNIATRPVSLLTTTVEGEYNAIRNGKFLYDERHIKLTGMPRYDFLENKPEKLVAVMPTWRRALSGAINPRTRERSYSKIFKESAYFNFWQRLLSDERICSKMRELGYRGLFVIHPCHLANAPDFKGNDVFAISRGFADYTKLKSEASLMVTDYSSAVFEYSYLKKPIVYAQADRDEFYGHHTYVPGFFDYNRDGFGPVAKSYEEAVAAVVNYLESDCRMEPEYQNRVDRFFTFKDRNNCRRVYDAIKAL
ncbi:MAG: CDP-glycerol glycerophosphotransferase family protein, partial [Kiritimatiellae bacterium]|nr:CDP-glycerol glycerophosphotransferase family protein [Kiritimatiellia bacterium]